MAKYYRGDQIHVDRFEIEKTSVHGLLGKGVYLTKDHGIARTYRYKNFIEKDERTGLFNVISNSSIRDRNTNVKKYCFDALVERRIKIHDCCPNYPDVYNDLDLFNKYKKHVKKSLRELNKILKVDLVPGTSLKYGQTTESVKEFFENYTKQLEANGFLGIRKGLEEAFECRNYWRKRIEPYVDRLLSEPIAFKPNDGRPAFKSVVVKDLDLFMRVMKLGKMSAFDIPDEIRQDGFICFDKTIPLEFLSECYERKIPFGTFELGSTGWGKDEYINATLKMLSVEKAQKTVAWYRVLVKNHDEMSEVPYSFPPDWVSYQAEYQSSISKHVTAQIAQLATEMGYVGAHYKGGVLGGKKHDALCVWDEELINFCRVR